MKIKWTSKNLLVALPVVVMVFGACSPLVLKWHNVDHNSQHVEEHEKRLAAIELRLRDLRRGDRGCRGEPKADQRVDANTYEIEREVGLQLSSNVKGK